MKPLNYDDNGCNNISSNCVIWQGPDIKCINLCKGDTVTDVVYKLATELCDILDILNIDSYSLDCFAGANEPVSFKELIQLVITQLCDIPTVISNINSRISTTPTTGCPDCVLNLPTCFQFVNGFGDTVTQAQLTEYVTSIGNRVCDLIVEITTLQIAVADNTTRITILENTPPPTYVPPTVTPTCVLPSVPEQMDIVLAALEAQFCELRLSTGGPVDIYTNIVKQCAGLNTDTSLANSGLTMSSIPGWTSLVSNMAQAFGNMWLTVCDLRTAVRNIQLNCCPSGCDGIDLTLTAILNDPVLSIYITGTIPAGFVECTGNTAIKITDSSGSTMILSFSLLAFLNNPGGYTVDFSSSTINTALDITIDILPCLSNATTNATCKSCLSYVVKSTANCPDVTLTSGTTFVSYGFTSLSGNYTYTAELYDSTYGTLVASQTQASGSTVPVSGTFNSLSASTVYNVRLTIVPTACLECPPTVCEFNTVTTADCPTLVLGSTLDTINFSFLSLAGNYTYTTQLYDSTETILIDSDTQSAGSLVPVSGSFTGLAAGTTYKIRLLIVLTTCVECPVTPCPFDTIATQLLT